MDVCVSCRAAVIWTLTERGKPMPVDAEPSERGNLLLSHRHVGADPVALYQSPEQLVALRAQHQRSPQEGPLRLFTSHFATCPHAARHRKRKAAA